MRKGGKMSKIEWTPYLAAAYAEGFCEGEGAPVQEQLEAWAYLIKHGICWQLQGWFGRNAHALIENGLISKDGVLNQEALDELLLEA